MIATTRIFRRLVTLAAGGRLGGNPVDGRRSRPVAGSIFISAFSMYRYDASYAVEVQRAHPGRFAIVKPVDPDDPAADDVIADWKQTPGAVGIRIMMMKEAKRDPSDPGIDRSTTAPPRSDH